MLHQQFVKKEKQKFEFEQQLRQLKNDVDTAIENEKIYKEIKTERRRFLMTSYLMKGIDDLEKILETLKDHFSLIRLTSFEELARNNTENKSAKELLDLSNNELKLLAKQLDLLRIDEEDVRYDVFQMIYEMLFDNIELRTKQNKLNSRIISQSQLNIEKTISNYFKKNHKTIIGVAQHNSIMFKQRLMDNYREIASKVPGATPGATPNGQTPKQNATATPTMFPDGDEDESNYSDEEEEYYDEEDEDEDEADEEMQQRVSEIMSGQRSRYDGQNNVTQGQTAGASKKSKSGKQTKTSGKGMMDLDAGDDDDDVEEMQRKMLPQGEEPGIDFDDDDEYAAVMGKAKSKSKSKGKDPQPRPSVQNLLKKSAMEKVQSSMHSNNRGMSDKLMEEMMYGMEDLMDQQPDDGDWDEDMAMMSQSKGSRRKNGSKKLMSHEDDWDDGM